ncbi:sugar transferase, partial [Halomonas sp.]|uniref:sugar transferase n=1 Tax=Halomonas sp. TaxID=1486246 RepID=UPI003566B45F
MTHKPSTSDWLRRAMRIFDAAIAILVSLLVLSLMPALDHTDGIEYPLLILVGGLMLPACGELLGLYQPWRGRSLFTMLGVYILGWSMAIFLLSLFLVATQSAVLFSRSWMALSSLSVLTAGVMLRSALYLYLRWLRSRGRNIKRVLLVGQEANRERVHRALAGLPYVGYRITREIGEPDVEQQLQELVRLSIFNRDFEEIWLSYPLSEGDIVKRLANILMAVPVDIRYFPDLSDLRLLNHRLAQVADMYSLDLNYSPLNGPMRLVKALEDRLLGLVLFLLFLPVMAVVATVIRWKMGSPVMFKQYRHGLDGKRFRIYKFRTMSAHFTEGPTRQTRPGDQRVTGLG